MLTHLFKLIWNKKKQNFLIMLELFFSFLVLFAVFTLIINYSQSYFKPRGFDFNNVWTVQRTATNTDGADTTAKDSARLVLQTIRQQVRSMPEIKELSYSSANTPYSNTGISTFLTYNKMKILTPIYTVEDSYSGLLDMQVLEGRWFNRSDDAANYTPAVVNQLLKEKLFGAGEALQQLVLFGDKKYKVIGVVNDMKNGGDYSDPDNGFYIRADTGFYESKPHMLIKVKPGTDPKFEAKLFKSLSNIMKNSSVEIVKLEDRRIQKNREQITPLIVLLLVVLFLIINVGLGLFGVLWHNINRRKGEIGLRRAIGATGKNISKQLVTEAIVLSTITLIVGSFFAIQFPLMNIFDIDANTYLFALLLAIVSIYLLAIICSLYPGALAAAIYPAIALHDE